MDAPTLAKKLGMTTHISGLLIKAKRLGLDAKGLECLAIQRGCDYYNEGEPLPPAIITEENDPEKIARLAKHERCESVVRYVAEAGRRFEPNNRFWQRLLSLLPVTR